MDSVVDLPQIGGGAGFMALEAKNLSGKGLYGETIKAQLAS